MRKFLVIVSAALAVLMLTPLAAFAGKGEGALRFSDVPNGKWYCDDVKKVCESGLMKGVSETEFDPDGTLTRGMCATILYRAAGEPAVMTAATFADVKAGEYYAEAVAWAQSEGVVNGKTATAFDPDGEITREEFAAMLYRYLDAEDLTLPETRDGEPVDADEVADYAAEAVDNMYKGEVVNGRENGAFDPDDEITRAETAAMITRLFEKVVVRWNEEYDHAFVSFPDELSFEGAKIDDIAVGYVPEGYVLHDTYEQWKSEFPESRLIVICDPEKNPEAPGRSGPGSVTVHIRSDVNECEFSDETLEMAEEISINGMAAVWAHADFEYEGEDLAWGRIAFGNKNLVIEILYIGVDHDEAIRIAESITATVDE
ncbi:MAG: S-layer homology domain-containing protein [Clostridia bacterium]|nr:S-layer homology domain-containing protein [Clostridia bacterium]